ncbi:T9SS type A sorting domain-containing protein [bacterium]|nr:T9SS type A sorting domain-containing protein [bacterium]
MKHLLAFSFVGVLSAASGWSTPARAQTHRCGSVEAYAHRLQNHPALDSIRQAGEQRRTEWLDRSIWGKRVPVYAPAELVKSSGAEGIQSLCGFDNTLLATLAAPTTLNQSITAPGNCISGGEYITVTNMVAGNIYLVSTCGANAFDTQLSIYDANQVAQGHNDDYCGSQSAILFNPRVSGTYHMLVDEYNCQTNNLCANLKVELVYQPRAVITIPTVVHVVYSTPTENISQAQIQSQIDALNEDFRRTNTNIATTPAAFRGGSDDVLIEFCLAEFDPQGNPSNGIVRKSTNQNSFNIFNNGVKFDSQGGSNAWDPNRYLNLWVCDISGGILGYAQFPDELTSSPSTDGVVIDYQYFGRIGTATAPYNLGRTATHEVGHWLGLKHIWGDDNGSCNGSDGVQDTPNQDDETSGCPSFPVTNDACSPNYPGPMFYNYMDYSSDACLSMFTVGQAGIMDAVMFNERNALRTSNGCAQSGIGLGEARVPRFALIPNPARETVEVHLDYRVSRGQVRLTDLSGRTLQTHDMEETDRLSLSVQTLSKGIYLVWVDSQGRSGVHRLQVD